MADHRCAGSTPSAAIVVFERAASPLLNFGGGPLDDRPPVHDEMEPHPVAEIFPKMVGADFEALVDDIRQYGQREPIVVHDGLILDGRIRYQACLQLGIKPLTAEWDGAGTPEAFVISMNIHRRHLGIGQRAMIAKRLATLSHGQKKADAQIGASSQAEAAVLFNVSRRSVQLAAVVQEKAAPELVEAVDRGDIPVSTAAQLVKLPKARQREIATARGKLAPRLAAKSARRMRIASRAAHMTHGSWILLRRKPSTTATCASCGTPGERHASRRRRPFSRSRRQMESARRRPIMPFEAFPRPVASSSSPPPACDRGAASRSVDIPGLARNQAARGYLQIHS